MTLATFCLEILARSISSWGTFSVFHISAEKSFARLSTMTQQGSLFLQVPSTFSSTFLWTSTCSLLEALLVFPNRLIEARQASSITWNAKAMPDVLSFVMAVSHFRRPNSIPVIRCCKANYFKLSGIKQQLFYYAHGSWGLGMWTRMVCPCSMISWAWTGKTQMAGGWNSWS